MKISILKSCAGLVVPMSGREYEESQKIRAETTYKISTRYFPGITADMRILHDGREFEIISIPTFSAPQIPMLAKGGMIRTAGSVIVGEKGAELLTLPRGAQVTPLARTSATKNTNHFDIRIYADGKSVDEIIDELIPKLKLALANL